MRSALIQVGCWTMFVAIFAGGGLGVYALVEGLNFTHDTSNMGIKAVGLYVAALGWAGASMAYQTYRRRRA